LAAARSAQKVLTGKKNRRGKKNIPLEPF
jgi:hypothetical protein